MVSSMTGEESDGNIVVLKDADRCGWKAPGCLWIDSCNRNVVIELLQTGTSNKGYVNSSWRLVRILALELWTEKIKGRPAFIMGWKVCHIV